MKNNKLTMCNIICAIIIHVYILARKKIYNGMGLISMPKRNLLYLGIFILSHQWWHVRLSRWDTAIAPVNQCRPIMATGGRDFPTVFVDTCLFVKTERVGFGHTAVACTLWRPGFSRVRNILPPGTAAIILLDVYDTLEDARCSRKW